MMRRLVRVLPVVLAFGCGGEPERSRVVPANVRSDVPPGVSDRPAPGPIRKVEMH